MSTETHPSTRRDQAVSPATPKTGPVTRIVLTSLVVGAATALTLALIVFPGGTESVITGSLLTGFGLGWVTTTGWAGAQNQLTHLSTNHLHRTVDSTHTGLLEDERPSTESVRAITDVVAAARRLDSNAPHPHRPHDRPATPGLAMIRTNERTAHVYDTFQGR